MPDEPCSIGSLSARGVEAMGAAEAALRAIQKYDEIAPHSELGGRPLLIEAETALGAMLGLVCTGELERDGFYDHSGDTCPIHEWLVEDDQGLHAVVLRQRATARYRGQTATVVISDYEDMPGHLHVELRMEPPMKGNDVSAYNAHPKLKE